VPPRVVALILICLTTPRCPGRPAADNAGETPSAPQRIVTIAPNSAEIICALGQCERLVGVSKFCNYPPELKDRPRVGGLSDPDLERIVALQPDLVVLRGRSTAVEQLCDRLELRLYMDETDTLPGIETCITDLGEILGVEEEARRMRKEFRGRLAAVGARASGRPRPTVLLTISRQPDKMNDILTTGRGAFLSEVIELAGGRNAFGHVDMKYPLVGAEEIIARRPDVIIELMPDIDLTDALRAGIVERWKRAGPLPAGGLSRIHFVTDDNCLTPSPRFVDIIDKIAAFIHPEPAVAP